MFHHLLIVIDDRAKAFRAVLVGLRLARCLAACVTVVFVVPALPGTREARAGSSRDTVTRGRAVFERVRRVASALGVTCTCRFAFGRDLDATTAEVIERNACDLVIVSTDGLRPVRTKAAWR
ncbi:universal stress protein [Luteibacter flocculans]|uniref:Universal stress protein n=1 Tax=Luteibacter flocculans TaxID=2780091 RepID=A0ABY4T832_9GAMM|nr:universal stress protein [Luteibacter flocculans]URL60103.1 universal stress protein [Luteibacter flocculans]